MKCTRRFPINYVDSFSDGINRNTFAHPRQITIDDPTPISFYIRYNYDSGMKTRVQGPPPSEPSQGVLQNFRLRQRATLHASDDGQHRSLPALYLTKFDGEQYRTRKHCELHLAT